MTGDRSLKKSLFGSRALCYLVSILHIRLERPMFLASFKWSRMIAYEIIGKRVLMKSRASEDLANIHAVETKVLPT